MSKKQNKSKNKYFQKKFDTYNNNYYLGLDIGTNSIGWAVHDEKADLIDFGVYLDNNIEDSKARRGYRSARRTKRRQKYRLEMFVKLAVENKLIDKDFINYEEEHNKAKYEMFSMLDNRLKDKREAFGNKKKYPTAYHLKEDLRRQKMIKEDIFLGLYHTLKLRGHFLSDISYENVRNNDGDRNTVDNWLEKHQINNPGSFFDQIVGINNDLRTNKERKKALEQAYDELGIEFEKKIDAKNARNNLVNEILFIMGYSVKLEHIEGMPADVKNFKIDAIDEQVDLPEETFANFEKIASILTVKNVLSDSETISISEYMVNKYNMYNPDNPEYEENVKLFNDENKEFIKPYIKDGKKIPYLRNFENRNIPNQLYYDEAMEILNEQKEFYGDVITDEFINNYGMLLKARIPYYVGPLAKYGEEYSQNSWINYAENNNGIKSVNPYNINKLDKTQINEEFIERMVKHDPYYPGQDVAVLPQRSYTYEYFKVLSDLSNFRIYEENESNGRHLTKSEKIKMIDNFYKNKENKSVTKSKIQKALGEVLGLDNHKLYNDNVDGDTVYANLKTYIELNIDNDLNLNDDQLDELAKILTLYEDSVLRRERVQKFFKDNNIGKDEKEIKKITLLRYTGYGNFSKKLLTEEIFEINGLRGSILDILLNEEVTFNEILAENDKEIANQEKIYKEKFEKLTKLDYSLVEEMYGSNQVKSMLNNLFIVMNEMHKIYGIPKEVTIEMARSNEESKQTKSRVKQVEEQVKELKKASKKDGRINKEMLEIIQEYINENNSIDDKMYLYLQQNGKDVYDFENGKPKNIDIDRLGDYDIDHIIPYSFNFDNSLNNKVLVHQRHNSKKNNRVPLEYIEDKRAYNEYITWLRKEGLISAKKRDNLLMDSLTKYAEQGFRNSQLNNTRYITKEIVAILKSYYRSKEEKVEINTINAAVIKPVMSRLRIIKIREISDKHHAIDAYMASVVYMALKREIPWLDNIKAGIIASKSKNDQEKLQKKLPKKEDFTSMYGWVTKIYKDIDGENIVKKIDAKEYRRVYKVRKKVTGQFWKENYISKKEEKKKSKGGKKLTSNDLIYYKNGYKKDNHMLQTLTNARVDIFRKHGENYIFAVPKSYFLQNGDKVKIDKDAYNYGLKMMNEKVWKLSDEITYDDFKFTLWKNDMYLLDDIQYFRIGGVNADKKIEGKKGRVMGQNGELTYEGTFDLTKLQKLFYEEKEGEPNKYRWKSKLELFETIFEDNNEKEIKFVKDKTIGSKKSISLLNILYWLKYFEYEGRKSSAEEEKKLVEIYYDTPEKHQVAEEYFKRVIEQVNFSENENKKIKKEFENLFDKKTREIIDFTYIYKQNNFQIIYEYDRVVKGSNNYRKNIDTIRDKEIRKIVQSPLGHKVRYIDKEPFLWEFEVR